MENKVFQTKKGYCHILPDRIVLSNSINVASVTKSTEKNNIRWRLIFYFALSIYLFYKSATLYQEDQMVRFILHTSVGLLLLYITIKSISNSSAGLIMRDSIQEVKFHEASIGTRAYFSVYFKDGKGKLKKRLIMLPGSLTGGKEEAAKAKAIMIEEHLLSQ